MMGLVGLAILASASSAEATLVCEKANGFGACLVVDDIDPNGPPACNGGFTGRMIGVVIYTPILVAGLCPVGLG